MGYLHRRRFYRNFAWEKAQVARCAGISGKTRRRAWSLLKNAPA